MTMAAALALIAGQTAGQDYAGTWIAERAGTTYARLELAVANGALAGRISLGDIQVDKTGQLTSVRPAPRDFAPLFALDRRDSGLVFARQDGADIDHFEMRLLGGDAAELVFKPSDADLQELAADGIPAPKPFRLKKVVR